MQGPGGARHEISVPCLIKKLSFVKRFLFRLWAETGMSFSIRVLSILLADFIYNLLLQDYMLLLLEMIIDYF